MLSDANHRSIGYLRLSLTEACSMRCVYCRPTWHGQPQNQALLSVDEIGQLVQYLAESHGLKKVRLTGGEPTSRADLPAIISRLAKIPQLRELAMTTNGLTLASRAREYADAGLHRVNVSLDTLHPQRFAQLTGVDGLPRVLAGLAAAEQAELLPIRLNTVVVRGSNDQDLPDLLTFAAEHHWEIRFIELMPMGPLATEWHERYVPESEMRKTLSPIVQQWTPLHQGHDAARRFQVTLTNGTEATIGFITPMSCNFCAACNRIRITSEGTLYPCLMDEPGPSLMAGIRPHFDADILNRIITEGLSHKRAEHPLQGPTAMIQLGG